MRQERADAQFLKLFVGKHQETAMFRLFISFIYTKTNDICQAVFPGTCLWMLIKKTNSSSFALSTGSSQASRQLFAGGLQLRPLVSPEAFGGIRESGGLPRIGKEGN